MISLRVSKRSTLQQRINLSNHSSGPKSNSNHIAISISFFLFGLSRDHKQLLLRSAVVARSELPFTFSQTLIIIAGETKLLLFFAIPLADRRCSHSGVQGWRLRSLLGSGVIAGRTGRGNRGSQRQVSVVLS